MKDKDKTKEQLIDELVKLRRRNTELEASETEHKRMEEKIIHLNQVLRSVRNVNQLITREKDRNKFLKGVCNNFIANQGYNNAWVAILGKGDELEDAVEAGLGEDFKPIVKRFEQGKITACGQKALSQSGVVITKNPVFSCKDCPLSSMYSDLGAMTIRLEYEGEVYGFISASVPKGFLIEKEEQLLFEEVARDIAFALYNIELEEKRKKAEEGLKRRTHELNERVKELNCLYGIEKIIRKTGITTKQALEEIVQLIPPSWQYPEITGCLVIFKDKKYKTKNFKETKWKQKADIIVDNKKAGAIEVCYLEEKPEIDEGPFLKEERALINSVSRRLGQFIELKQAEEVLGESEEKYRVLVENATDFIFMINRELKVLTLNKAAGKLWKKEPKEIIGKSIFEIFSEQIAIGYSENLKKVFETGKPHSSETRMVVGETETWINASLNPVRDKEGKIIAVMGISRDITEQKKAEEALRDSEEKWLSLTENTDDTIVVTDNNDVIRYISRTIPPTTPEGVVGKTVYEYVSREHHEIMRESLKNVYKTGNPDSYEVTLDMSRINPKIGTRWFNTKVVPIKTDKEVAGVIMIATDITERKKAEEALQKSEERFRMMAETSLDYIFQTDEHGKTAYCSPAVERILGYTPEERQGSDFTNTVLPSNLPIAQASFKSVMKGEIVQNQEINLLHKSGRTVPLEVSIVPIFEDKEVIGLFGIGRDITEQKKAEEKIKTALKEKEVMLKEIHHRVKNNMQIMSSLLKLQFARTKSKKLQAMLRSSQNRIHSMALIHEKLYQSEDFARIDFAYYIRSLTVHLFHSYRVNTNIVRLEMDVRDVHLDINRAIPCGLIVNELVSNSLKHAFPGGREGEIFIKFYSNKRGKITLVVSNNGIGFPEDIDFRSTESFGMQVVNDLVEQLRGTIELDRKGGTTFKVVF